MYSQKPLVCVGQQNPSKTRFVIDSSSAKLWVRSPCPLSLVLWFKSPPSPSTPPLVIVNRIVVNLDCKGWQNLQSLSSLLQSVMKLFTVGNETYIGTHRTVPVSFITDCKSYAIDCKSDDSDCKFCQPLQSVTIAKTAIQLTITRGGRRLKSDPVRPGEVIENSNFWFHTSRGGVLGGGRLKSFHRNHIQGKIKRAMAKKSQRLSMHGSNLYW